MHLVFYKRDCVLAMELWVDYMRETASLLIHIDISKMSHFWKYFLYYVTKKLSDRKKIKASQNGLQLYL